MGRKENESCLLLGTESSKCGSCSQRRSEVPQPQSSHSHEDWNLKSKTQDQGKGCPAPSGIRNNTDRPATDPLYGSGNSKKRDAILPASQPRKTKRWLPSVPREPVSSRFRHPYSPERNGSTRRKSFYKLIPKFQAPLEDTA